MYSISDWLRSDPAMMIRFFEGEETEVPTGGLSTSYHEEVEALAGGEGHAGVLKIPLTYLWGHRSKAR
jgi:hypothetical protein